MTAQPTEQGTDRFPLLAEITRQRAEAARAKAAAAPPAEELTEPTFTLSWRDHGRDHAVDLDALDDDAFAALPERVRAWRAANTYAAVEDIRWMVAAGETLEGVAARLTALRGRNVGVEAVEVFLRRHGAEALVHQLKGSMEFDTTPAPVSPPRRRKRGGRSLTEAEVDDARRKWIEGPQDADEIEYRPGSTLRVGRQPRPAGHRSRRGAPVRGVRL